MGGAGTLLLTRSVSRSATGSDGPGPVRHPGLPARAPLGLRWRRFAPPAAQTAPAAPGTSRGPIPLLAGPRLTQRLAGRRSDGADNAASALACTVGRAGSLNMGPGRRDSVSGPSRLGHPARLVIPVTNFVHYSERLRYASSILEVRILHQALLDSRHRHREIFK